MLNTKPKWLNKKIDFRSMHKTGELLQGLNLHTVCHQARCPNISECFERGTATFLILGDTCTRNCAFCSVGNGTPSVPDPDEPERILEAVRRLVLSYIVITSVTRDDLPDGGAAVFAKTINILKNFNPELGIEVLVPDFKGDQRAIETVLGENPDVFAHNIETVPSQYSIRPGALYKQSLNVLETAAKCSNSTRIKSALLLGLGETVQEVKQVLSDLRNFGCDYLSIGQYLQPGKKNYPVQEYITPVQFEQYKDVALSLGFLHVESGPYVRSSYFADRYR